MNTTNTLTQASSSPQETEKIFMNSEQLYRRIIQSVVSGIYVADTKGKLVFANQSFIKMLGFSKKGEVIGSDISKQLYARAEDRKAFLSELERKGAVSDYEIELKRKDGIIIIISTTSNYIKNKEGNIMGVTGIIRDITERKRLETELNKEKGKIEQILSFDEQLNSFHKADRLYDFIADKILEILEAQKCSLMLIDKEAGDLCIKSIKGHKNSNVAMKRVKMGDPVAGIVAVEGKPLLIEDINQDPRFHRRNRKAYLGASFISVPIKLENNIIGIINVADKNPLTGEKIFTKLDLKILGILAREVAIAIENLRLYRELEYLTVTDPLTHINNYRHFAKSLDYEIKRSKRSFASLTLLMADIDDFKSYNDTFGHLEGDALLRKVGKVLKDNLRDIDIACRYAGDEFIAILPLTDVAGGKMLSEKIQKDMARKNFKQPVTLSIGVAKFIPGLTRYDLVSKVDSALYEAKKKGKNMICVYG